MNLKDLAEDCRYHDPCWCGSIMVLYSNNPINLRLLFSYSHLHILLCLTTTANNGLNRIIKVNESEESKPGGLRLKFRVDDIT